MSGRKRELPDPGCSSYSKYLPHSRDCDSLDGEPYSSSDEDVSASCEQTQQDASPLALIDNASLRVAIVSPGQDSGKPAMHDGASREPTAGKLAEEGGTVHPMPDSASKFQWRVTVGSKLLKRFGSKFHEGTVTRVPTRDHPYYHVVYEDDDEEDMADEEELIGFVSAWREKRAGAKKFAEINSPMTAPCKFLKGDTVFVKDGSNDNGFKVKVLNTNVEEGKELRRTYWYFVHFMGWNEKWDKWVEECDLLEDSEENQKWAKEAREHCSNAAARKQRKAVHKASKGMKTDWDETDRRGPTTPEGGPSNKRSAISMLGEEGGAVQQLSDSASEFQPRIMVGAKLLKRFGSKFFEGTVTRVPTRDHPYYHVVYEDDDEEDLTDEEELIGFVSAWKDNHAGAENYAKTNSPMTAPCKFLKGDTVFLKDGGDDGYRAKILNINMAEGKELRRTYWYFVHFMGWSKKWDDWVEECDLVEDSEENQNWADERRKRVAMAQHGRRRKMTKRQKIPQSQNQANDRNVQANDCRRATSSVHRSPEDTVMPSNMENTSLSESKQRAHQFSHDEKIQAQQQKPNDRVSIAVENDVTMAASLQKKKAELEEALQSKTEAFHKEAQQFSQHMLELEKPVSEKDQIIIDLNLQAESKMDYV